MSVSVFDHGILQSLFCDTEFTEIFSVNEDLKTMLWFEAELAIALAKNNVIPKEASDNIVLACKELKPDVEALSLSTFKDGVVVPELVRQIKASVSDEYVQYVHKGATSQDVIDSSLVIRLSRIFPKVDGYLQALISTLEELKTKFGDKNMMAHTRMQIALEITVADKINSWIKPLKALKAEFGNVSRKVLNLQFGGAVGTLNVLGSDAEAVSSDLAKQLGLGVADGVWHTNRLNLVCFTDWLSHLCGVLGKIGADIALLSQNEVGTIRLSGGGGSSAMPHKNNPVRAEILITLSSYQSTLASAMHKGLVHENERSGASWSLEWIVLPQMVAGASGAMKNALGLFHQIRFCSSGD